MCRKDGLSGRKARILMELSEFEIPPTRDALVIGKHSALGKRAAQRMIESVAPEQFTMIEVKDEIIEAIYIRQAILRMIPEEIIKQLVLAEAKRVMSPEEVLKIKIDSSIIVERTLELEGGADES